MSGSRARERKECEMRLRSCSYFHNAVNEFNFILEDWVILKKFKPENDLIRFMF